jgi:L-2-hydroxyglutarate oxidase LhgO
VSDRIDCVVVGAGVVGLAVGRALALQGREVVVIERHSAPCQETSSRNSGVIHSGIYYPAGSQKARLCVRGRTLLYEFCDAKGVNHLRCGKVIVAQASQLAALAQIEVRARANGVDDLQVLTGSQIRDLEPEVRAAAGLFSPSTGIVDVHELAMALIADLESAGGSIAYNTAVDAIDVSGPSPVVRVTDSDDSTEIVCNVFVNSAGLDAIPLLRRMDGYPPQRIPWPYFAKGSYFSLTGVNPFRHLVYPIPSEAGLGIHATLDLAGSTRFGPNVRWVEGPEYLVDEGEVAEFYDAIRTYWPGLPAGSLQPGYAGVRPKLVGPGTAAADFVIEGAAAHGCSGLINLLGIESPGLTSSLAIGELVAELMNA